MLKKICPICDTDIYAKIEYKENLPSTSEKINFSGRKTPDGYHYEMVRCANCSLLYARSVYETVLTNKLYKDSSFLFRFLALS